MTTSPHGIQTFPLSPCFFGVTLYSQQILQIHTVSNTNTCFSHTCTHNQLQCPAALVSSLHHQKQQQHSIRTKLLRRRGLVAQVLPIEMQTLWYGNWQLQKTARIHTSMHWNHLRNVRWDGTSSQDNTDKWTKPARLGRVREGAKVERVERRRRRSRGRRREGERGRKTVVCPFPLTPYQFLQFTVSAFVVEKDSSWAEMQDFRGATSTLSSKTTHYAPLAGGQNFPFNPQEILMGMSSFFV